MQHCSPALIPRRMGCDRVCASMAYIHTYIHTYIHSYIHTYIHTYIHIHIHNHTHTHTFTPDTERHGPSQPCKKLQKKRANVEAALIQNAVDDMRFTIRGEDIERLKEFKYLGRILDENDNDKKCILAQLRKARGLWRRLVKILKREGAEPFQMGRFYVGIVQAILLYGSESWTISLLEMEALEGFQKKAIRFMTGRHTRQDSREVWHYPYHCLMMRECWLKPISYYIQKRNSEDVLWKV